MLRTVVFNAHQEFLPPHVDAGERQTVVVAHNDLRLRSAEAGVDQQQSRPRLLRRFRSAVHQVAGAPQ
jgi:hypothetical protein